MRGEDTFTCESANWPTLFAQERIARERAERQSNGWEDDYNKLIYELREVLGGAPEDEGIDETARKVKAKLDAANKRIAELETAVAERNSWE